MPGIQDVGKFFCNPIFAIHTSSLIYVCVCRCLDMCAYNDMNTETKMGAYLNMRSGG